MVVEGEKLWEPSGNLKENANITRFITWLNNNRDLNISDYDTLWQWSVDNIEEFWSAFTDFFNISFHELPHSVLGQREMPGAEWFPGATLNYAEHVLRADHGEETALFALSENRPLEEISWTSLASDVRRAAQGLRALGVGPGDRIACFLPNIKEAVVALLATTAVGAIFSSCSPDFGAKSVIDRFAQIEPKILFACDGYVYGQKPFDCRNTVTEIADALPSLEKVIWLPHLNDNAPMPQTDSITYNHLLESQAAPGAKQFQFEPVPFDHPLWIVYSSGTTGLPKPIVHGHGGIILEMLKFLGFHLDLKTGSRNFFFTTTGWVMWNITISSLITGAAAIIYDGNPGHPDTDILWRMAAETKANVFGASPTYIQLMIKAGVIPKERYGLSNLTTVMLGGSPATPEIMKWFYDNVGNDLWVTSQSGGTDVCSAFVGASPTLPVHAGEIQTRMLGVDVCAFDDEGNEIIDDIGELVIRQPMPSMPVCFWGDDDKMSRLRASYFEDFPGVWRHGDFLKITKRGSCIIYGRSDSTLNRYGVRIGTAEIYRSVEAIDGVEDSLIVNLDLPDGKFFMPLFLKLAKGIELTDTFKETIKNRLRSEYSPRHVPDALIAVQEIPYTLTGKKMEVPVRKILMGMEIDKAANRDAMKVPEAIDFFAEYAAQNRP